MPGHQGVLNHLGIRESFTAVVSADEVTHGKPAPDIYLEAARRLGVDPRRVVAFEDSANGAAAARAAGMKVIAVPNRQYADPRQFAGADRVLHSLVDFRPAMLAALFNLRQRPA